MLTTHGGPKKGNVFKWSLDGGKVVITVQQKTKHEYSISEILAILKWLDPKFGFGWFPLANNVEKL